MTMNEKFILSQKKT